MLGQELIASGWGDFLRLDQRGKHFLQVRAVTLARHQSGLERETFFRKLANEYQ